MNNTIVMYGVTVNLLPYLTYPEEQKLKDKLLTTNNYVFKSGKNESDINGWFIFKKGTNKPLSRNEQIKLFQYYFPKIKLTYFK